MPESWNEGVRGTQVPLLINLDADTIRCVAGPGSGKTAANIHVVTWKTPEAEAAGMAAAIVNNIHAHPSDRHLAMVTRRQFGYWLRDKIAKQHAKEIAELEAALAKVVELYQQAAAAKHSMMSVIV